MSAKSKIEWTEATWNPVTGCTKVSLGCKHCYAERIAKRLKAMGQPNYVNGFSLALHNHLLETPLQWKTPKLVFVNSMSDLFHKDVSLDFILRVFNTMNTANWHIFQVLTKRSERLLDIDKHLTWSENIWMGVSVETAKYLSRIDDLRETNALLKFISFEPLLGSIGNFDLSGIDWVIVGGESGPYARQMNDSWVIEIKDRCKELGIPFFFKQWGGTVKKRNGRILEGRTWNEFPVKLRNYSNIKSPLIERKNSQISLLTS